MSTSTAPFTVAQFPPGADLGLLHITAMADRAVEDVGEIEALFRDLEARVETAHGQVIQEKIFVSRAGADAVVAAREVIDSEIPPTMVVAEPCAGGALAGVQILAAICGHCETVLDGSEPVGRIWSREGLKMLALAGVHGTPGEPVPDQLAAMFARAGDLVAAQGFEFQQVARTWIYVEPLLEFYADLNQSRDRFFRSCGLLGPHSHPPPASTGIQGGHPGGAACQMDVVALSGDSRLSVDPMRTSHQCEAYDYGSAFSRGVTVQVGADRLLYASGTASIDVQGRTAHVGDSEGQSRETFAAVETLLGHQGASLADAVTGVLFFKENQGLRAWESLRRRGLVPDLPSIAVYADVCRPDLLVELELTAVG